jgi:hypothetical protein
MGKITAFSKSLALSGVLSGLAIAIVVPFLAFVASGSGVIPAGGAIAIAIVAVIAGAPIVLVSAFFGIVIPSSVEKSDDERHGHHKDKGHKQEKDEATKESEGGQG